MRSQRRFRSRVAGVSLLTVLLLCTLAPAALPPDKAQALYDRVKPSLVAVQYVYNNELGRHEFIGAGIVVSDDGLVMTSMALMPQNLPNAQLTEFKIIIPGDAQTELDAVFQGRDERCNVAFVKTKDPQKWTSLKFVEQPAKVGDGVIAVGLMPKEAGYTTYLMQAVVAAPLRGPVPMVLVGSGGLCVVGSPVFNEDGAAIGMINGQSDQSVLLNDTNNPLLPVLNPPHLYVPARDFLQSLSDPPTQLAPLKLPWLGVAAMTGLKKEVAEYENLQGQTAVQIGDVLAGYPAAKGGLKSGDVIVKMNGQPLERGDEPDEAAAILLRAIRRLKVGTDVTFSVLREKGKPLTDIKVTLEEQPKSVNEAARFFADDLGFVTRELVLEDTYERKLPQETPGVLVALVKPTSAAATAQLHYGDLVTQLNQTAVTDLPQFQKDYVAFRKANPHGAVVLEVLRGVDTQVIRIEPPQ